MSYFVKNLECFVKNRIPPQLVIQITNHCNAACPQCGMRVTADLGRHSLALDELKRIIDAAAVQGVQAISFTGGEPLLFIDTLIELINHAGRLGIPYIRTGTNGFLFRRSQEPGFTDRIQRLVERLAGTPLRNFWISLDSFLPEVHESMRGLKGVVAGIEKALPLFNAAGLYPSANLGINRRVGGDATRNVTARRFSGPSDYLAVFYERFAKALDDFYFRVADLGFTIVNTCYPMSIDDAEKAQGLRAVYGATSTDDIVQFTHAEKGALYQALMDTIIRHRHRLRIFSPLAALYMLRRQYAPGKAGHPPFGCRGGSDFFFIDACDGNTYPCGYRGNENLGKFTRLKVADRTPSTEPCHRCDWECFRDPSELCAPVLTAFTNPLALAIRLRQDPVYARLWWRDMRYYRACGWFDGRSPMHAKRLERFRDVSTPKPAAEQR